MPRRTTIPPTPDEAVSDAPVLDEPLAEEPHAEEPRPEALPGSFGWLRRLDLPRTPGWIGGVCAGVAAKLGVDPILVRGVVVVIAVLGGPVALLYALAWFLLPGPDGTIHAQELGRGRVTRALPGIVAVFLASFLPLAQGFWFTGAFYWGDFGGAGPVVRILWTAALIVAAVVAVVWLARRAGSVGTSAPSAGDAAAESRLSGEPAPASAAAPREAHTPPSEPPAPPTDASADELATWRAGQEEWKRHHAAWTAEQRRTHQERRRAEAQARAAEALAASRERQRIDDLTRPHAGAGVVALVFGVALVAAALAALVAQGGAETRGAEWMIGAAVLAGVLALGIVVVGLARRRSGFLSFLGILSVVALAAAIVVPTDRQVLPPGANYSLDRSVDGRYAQLAGSTEIYVFERGDDDPTVIDLWQLTGGVRVSLDEGASVRIEATSDSRMAGLSVEETFEDGGGRFSDYRFENGALTATVGGGEPDLVLRVWIGSGAWLSVSAMSAYETPLPLSPEPASVTAWGADGQTLTPTPVPTEGVTP